MLLFVYLVLHDNLEARHQFKDSLSRIPDETKAAAVLRIRNAIATFDGVSKEKALELLWDDLVIAFGKDGAENAFLTVNKAVESDLRRRGKTPKTIVDL